jgi:hypothetical protein
MRVLVDTHVLLDVLGRREPHWPQASRVWTLAETGHLMDTGLPDFEDAMQYFSAVHARADIIITRNPEDFPRAGPTVMPPGEWLAAFSKGGV